MVADNLIGHFTAFDNTPPALKGCSHSKRHDTRSSRPSLAVETIQINARSSAHPFPHFWERMFGSGRAILTLRDSYRRDLRDVKRISGFEYVRFHAIFHDEVGVYDEDKQGRSIYNFSYVDQIYDGLLENGIRPFIELSFIPRKLASKKTSHPFWYKQIIAPPKSWARWEDLIYQFTKHLVARYGIKEVAQWYFEVWNEPNINFWAGKPKEATYYKLYDHTARALKRVSLRLRVGGPATARAAWVDRFIEHCVKKRVPVDFVSTHVYANDTAKNVLGTNEEIPRSEMVARAVRKVHEQVKNSARPDLPIHWTEYNASYMNEVRVTDSAFMGPWLANTIRQCDGFVTTMAYWTFSDVLEEQGVVKRPFYGGYGLIAAGNIPKASYNAFKLLHQLGTERIMVDSSSALVTRRTDGSLAIAVWNYAPPEEDNSPKRVTLEIEGLTGAHRLRIHLLDPKHGSPLSTWEAIGEPPFPTPEQLRQLRAAAELAPPKVRPLPRGNVSTASLDLPPHGLALIEVIK
jgi:xylan 1,4-beta-xylosidase